MNISNSPVNSEQRKREGNDYVRSVLDAMWRYNRDKENVV